jgi:hypothetical protein
MGSPFKVRVSSDNFFNLHSANTRVLSDILHSLWRRQPTKGTPTIKPSLRNVPESQTQTDDLYGRIWNKFIALWSPSTDEPLWQDNKTFRSHKNLLTRWATVIGFSLKAVLHRIDYCSSHILGVICSLYQLVYSRECQYSGLWQKYFIQQLDN